MLKFITFIVPTMLFYMSADTDPYRNFMQNGNHVSCCGGTDCAPLPDDDVKAIPGGYQVAGFGFVPNSKAQTGFDQHYHLCRSAGTYATSTVYCFLIPSPGI